MKRGNFVLAAGRVCCAFALVFFWYCSYFTAKLP